MSSSPPDSIRTEAMEEGIVYVVGRTQVRLFLSGFRQRLARGQCIGREHNWGPWKIEDPETASAHLREARPGEQAWRQCERCCGAREDRYPKGTEPTLWREL